MKTIYAKFSLILLCVMSFAACTDFDELNTDPTKSNNINPNPQLSMVQLQTWGSWQMSQPYTFYLSGFIQHMQGDYNASNWGGQYRQNDSEMGNTWNAMYGSQIRNLVDIIHRTEGKEEYTNIHAIARIYKVFVFSTLTDIYGDLPYFDAGKGAITGNVKPAYDKQELIYKDFFKELSAAVDSLDIDKDAVSGDIIYKGNIDKWKRFANSLHLRLAMRVVNADAELAKQEAIKAVEHTAGLLTSSSDDALISYMNIFDWESTEYRRNGLAQMWRGREPYPTVYLCSTFWNMLKDSSDPRLLVYGRCYNENSANDPFGRIDLTDEMLAVAPDKFQPVLPGFYWWDNWPSGYWSTSTEKWQDKATRPQVNNIFLKGDVPGVIMTYAEVELLLSEAKARWSSDIITGSIAGIHYRNGVREAILFLKKFGAENITDTSIDNFITANPFPTGLDSRLESINNQLWILHFNNAPEAFANWRRSGIPALKSSVDYGAVTIDSRTIPRRLCYPLFEGSYNKEGYDSALATMGGKDDWNARVWWDKK